MHVVDSLCTARSCSLMADSWVLFSRPRGLEIYKNVPVCQFYINQ